MNVKQFIVGVVGTTTSWGTEPVRSPASGARLLRDERARDHRSVVRIVLHERREAREALDLAIKLHEIRRRTQSEHELLAGC